jgi:putative Holliday junction resolvase
MKRVAFDLGAARIGIAASDETGRIAFARGALARRERRRDLEALARVVREEGAAEVVVGLPLCEDGSEGEAALSTRRFAARLESTLGLRVVFQDERHSTLEAAEVLRSLGLDARRARGRIDAEAARVILQRYLDGEGRGPTASDAAAGAASDAGSRA